MVVLGGAGSDDAASVRVLPELELALFGLELAGGFPVQTGSFLDWGEVRHSFVHLGHLDLNSVIIPSL